MFIYTVDEMMRVPLFQILALQHNNRFMGNWTRSCEMGCIWCMSLHILLKMGGTLVNVLRDATFVFFFWNASVTIEIIHYCHRFNEAIASHIDTTHCTSTIAIVDQNNEIFLFHNTESVCLGIEFCS